MRAPRTPDLRALRAPLGLTQSGLARQIGVSRQALAAIEAGRSRPSVAVALRLAEALGHPVETLFGAGSSDERAAPERTGGSATRLAQAGAPLVMGCAPPMALLGAWWVHASSRDALAALGAGLVNVAGVHATSLAEIRAAVAHPLVVALTRWEAGFAVARGNPKDLRRPADLARRGVRVAGRARGTGARRWLDAALRRAGLQADAVLARSWIAPGHVEAAQAVALGAVDVGISIGPAALASGVDFVPFVEERFDLVMDERTASDARVTRLLDVVHARRFAKDLGALGYDAGCAGERVSP